jgi:hypothetical protein
MAVGLIGVAGLAIGVAADNDGLSLWGTFMAGYAAGGLVEMAQAQKLDARR